MTTAFDRALETGALTSAAEDFAVRHGHPGSSEYLSARVRFHQQARARGDGRRRRPTHSPTSRPPSNHLNPDHLVREVLDAAVQHAMRIDGATMANAQLLDPRTQALRLASQQGFSGEFVSFFNVVSDTTTAAAARWKAARRY
ncbi:MAG: hypothetical protein ACJ780_26310 [Solirubrobacteraceae bacterium]